MATTLTSGKVETYLGAKAESLLGFKSPKIAKERLHLPGPDFIDRIYAATDRNVRVLTNLQRMFGHGRLGGTGYLSILPVDQGIEHSAGASFAKNPEYFDGGNIVKLAVEGGCNAVASTYGVLGSVARQYAHKIPFIVKINHNELLTFPNKADQILFATLQQAYHPTPAALPPTIHLICHRPPHSWNTRAGASGRNVIEEAVTSAVINNRAGGTGLISGRKAFQRPMKEGVQLLNAVQDVYLSPDVTVA